MSDTATHGLKTYIEIEDPDNPGTFVDISDKCHNANAAFNRDIADTSTFGTGDKTNLSGMRGATFSVDYYSDQELRDLMWAIYLSPDPVRARYGPEGNASGKERQTAYFNLQNFGESGNITSAVGGPAQFERTGGTTRDTWA